jgi:kumamolisin
VGEKPEKAAVRRRTAPAATKEEIMASETHTPIPGSNRVALPGARALGLSNRHATIEVLLKLRPKTALPELRGRPAATMTREQLAASYGASEQDIDTVARAFEKFGLKMVKKDPAACSVSLSGTAAQMEKAFQVRLLDYEHPDGNYRGRVGEVHVPTEVHEIVQGVFGLDNRRVAHRRRHRIVHAAHARDVSSVPADWYIPSELAKHYNFPPGDGSGQTVGLLEFGGGYFPADLQQFCDTAGVAMPKVVTVSADGTSTSQRDGAEGEVMLDVEVVAGICPKATIAVYFAHFTEKGWIRVLDTVLRDSKNNPTVLSISWGFAEDALIWTRQAMAAVNEALKKAALLGITVCVASGDDGSSDAVEDGHAHVDFPASSPYVLAVGGTTIPGKNSGQPDICWKEGSGVRMPGTKDGSTGGGVSAVFERLNWQEGITVQPVNPGGIVGRCIPDIAANADWSASPYLLVVDGGAQPNGGTSAAAPLCASLIALINAARGPGKQLGYLTPLLYQTAGPGIGGPTIGAAGCTDVVSGDNVTDKIGGFSAGPGYDAVCGWGTPDGKKLMAALANH